MPYACISMANVGVCMSWRGRGYGFTFSTHGDGVGNTNGVVLPAEHSLFFYSILDGLGEIEH